MKLNCITWLLTFILMQVRMTKVIVALFTQRNTRGESRCLQLNYSLTESI